VQPVRVWKSLFSRLILKARQGRKLGASPWPRSRSSQPSSFRAGWVAHDAFSLAICGGMAAGLLLKNVAPLLLLVPRLPQFGALAAEILTYLQLDPHQMDNRDS